jgi:hypothetical protein
MSRSIHSHIAIADAAQNVPNVAIAVQQVFLALP